MYSILLVEDEKWVRTAIRKVIERTNLPFQVVKEATNGIEALDWLKVNKVELIFTDIRMPIMDGLAFVQQVRDNQMKNDIVIISGYDDFAYAQKAIKMDVRDYLLKPVEQEDMLNCLNKWLTVKQKQIEDRNEPNMESQDELSTIERVIRFINQSMPGDISLKETAKEVHLNASYLSQLFKEECGKNFNEYVTEQKMKGAAELLVRTSLRISEVAERCGYSDIAYFTNSFKKFFGTTPSHYRKSNKAKV